MGLCGWLWPALRLGRTEDGLELLRALLPERRRTQIYQAEPYVLAADVYAAPGHLGRGRLELVHRGGGVVLPHRGGGAAGPEGPGRPLVCGAPPAGGLAGLDGEWELDRGRLSIQVSRGESSPSGWTAREIRDGVPLRELTGDHRLEVTAAPGMESFAFPRKMWYDNSVLLPGRKFPSERPQEKGDAPFRAEKGI